MDYVLNEIKKYKNKLNDITNKLINIIDINQEISITKEIKNEIEFLSSLLNIKKNLLFPNKPLNNDINNINDRNDNTYSLLNKNDINIEPLQKEEFPIELYIPIDDDFKNKNLSKNNYLQRNQIKGYKINLRKSYGRFAGNIVCLPDEKIANVIERYKNKYGDYNLYKKFVFKDKDLLLDSTVSEAGIKNNSNIIIFDWNDNEKIIIKI